MAELFAILLIVEVILLIATVILFLCGLETVGSYTAIVMLIMLVVLWLMVSFIGLENILSGCECGCENCMGEIVGKGVF